LAIGGLVSLPSVSGVEGPSPNVVPPASLPSRAIGGPVTNVGGPNTGGPPYIVGERGPEIFIPRESGRIIPNNSLTTDSIVNSVNDPSKTDSIVNSVNAPSKTDSIVNSVNAPSTTGRPVNSVNASSPTGSTINSVNTSSPTGRLDDAVPVNMRKQSNPLNRSEQQTPQNEIIPPQNKIIPPQNKPIPSSQQTQYQNGQTQQPESSERRPLISQSPTPQFGLGDIPSQHGNTTVPDRQAQIPPPDSFVKLSNHLNLNYPNISV
jgi:hypothetical protein